MTKKLSLSMGMYSELVKCEFRYHTPDNRWCKNREVKDRMYNTKYGVICVNCYKILETKGKKAKQALMSLK